MLSQILRHGIEHPDYFQGCGVSFTTFSACATGIGDTERAAFDDALECIAQSHDAELAGAIEKAHAETEWSAELADGEMVWHVSIRYTCEVPK